MNLSRTLAGFLSSNSRKWSLLRPVALLQPSPYSTEAAPAASWASKKNPNRSNSESEGESRKPLPRKDPSGLLRPTEIPFQPKIANSVRLVGVVGLPMELQTLSDGFYAVSVLVSEKTKEFPGFWIPIIFQGDLAQIAACHLKEKDLVYVTGQLSGDAPSFTIKDAQANIQVLVDSVSFVQSICPGKESHIKYEQDDLALDSPGDLEKLNVKDRLWSDLADNPQQWWDNRVDKLNGSVSPKYPDFKHRDTQKALWLDSAPEWVSSKLDGLVFDGSNDETKQRKDANVGATQKTDKEKLWRNFVDNPNKWWDNRSSKLKPNHPDFKHKDTGEALWLGSSTPPWVLEKLPPLDTKQEMAHKKTTVQDTLLF